MECQKSSQITSSSSVEVSERANAKIEKDIKQLHYQHLKNEGYRRRSYGGEDSHSTLKRRIISIST